jgi:hypothetical protein
MKLKLAEINDIIKVNSLKRITNPKLFKKGVSPADNGLLDPNIVGYATADRREFFSYVDLGQPYIHPHIYKNVLCSSMRLIQDVVAGKANVSVIKGKITKDPDGWTGIQGLYKHWNEITTWTNNATSEEKNNSKLLKMLTREEVFYDKWLIIPVMYRDIQVEKDTVTKSPVNQLYSDLIRKVEFQQTQKNVFNFNLYATEASIQNTLCDIYNHFVAYVGKKGGLIKKHLLSKAIDYGVRSVISAPTYTGDASSESFKYGHVYIPLAQACVLVFPFVSKYVRDYFRTYANDYKIPHKYIDEGRVQTDYVIKDPEIQFDDDFCRKLINDFVETSASRFNVIMITVLDETSGEEKTLPMTEERTTEIDGNVTRSLEELTLTDICYRAAVDSIQNKHTRLVRYPITDIYGMFICKSDVISTAQDMKATINGIEYDHYPIIDKTVSHDAVGPRFIDVIKFSNSYLSAIGGDYDGDMVSLQTLYTEEANEEAERLMTGKLDKLSLTGKCVRTIENEALLAAYMLTV